MTTWQVWYVSQAADILIATFNNPSNAHGYADLETTKLGIGGTLGVESYDVRPVEDEPAVPPVTAIETKLLAALKEVSQWTDDDATLDINTTTLRANWADVLICRLAMLRRVIAEAEGRTP